MEQANAIELKNITKRFGEVVANDSVDLSVKHGEILSVLGENGSGKTTLMNMISGIYFPDEGQIFVDGEEVSICSPKDSFALGIGMIHQHFKLVDVMTAKENVIIGQPAGFFVHGKKLAKEVKELSDGWTVKTADGGLSAHYEHSIAFTEEGIMILTAVNVPDFIPYGADPVVL